MRSAPLVCGNCGNRCRRRFTCPCELTECTISDGVCSSCRRFIERNAQQRAFRDIPDWLDLDYLAALTVNPPAGWQADKACGGEPLATFYPAVEFGAFDFAPAAAICGRCPVRHECLADHLPTMTVELDRQSGCYIGGTTPTQRTAIRRTLASQGAA